MAAAWRLLVERPAVARSRDEERLAVAERGVSAWRLEAALVRDEAWRLGTAAARLDVAEDRAAVGRDAVLREAVEAVLREGAAVLREELPDCAEARASARAEASLGSSVTVRQRPRKPAIKERMKPPSPIQMLRDITSGQMRQA